MLLASFDLVRPRQEARQEEVLEWLADVHARAAGEPAERMARIVRRVCCGPDRIATRGYSAPELFADGAVPSTAARTDAYARDVEAVFRQLYDREEAPPDDLVHVTCTGYVSPSGAQRIVAAKGWRTRVTHAYHMGCYAAIPALRIALGCLAPSDARRRARRVDVVHTELCSLHFDSLTHTPEQLVVQSLFADGSARYVATDDAAHGLRVLALDERIAADTADEMQWRLGDRGMRMSLSRTVPERIAASIRPFATDLFAAAGFDLAREKPACFFAVHPGGPKIIDAVRDALELGDAQVEASRRTLSRYGNMSSATLPHVWADLLADEEVPRGALVASVAFGPGLTTCGALFRKE